MESSNPKSSREMSPGTRVNFFETKELKFAPNFSFSTLNKSFPMIYTNKTQLEWIRHKLNYIMTWWEMRKVASVWGHYYVWIIFTPFIKVCWKQNIQRILFFKSTLNNQNLSTKHVLNYMTPNNQENDTTWSL